MHHQSAGGVPSAGLSVPVSGFILGGSFFPDLAPYYCQTSSAPEGDAPWALGSLSESATTTSSSYNSDGDGVRCMIAGSVNGYASEAEAEAIASELARAALLALKAQHGLLFHLDDHSTIDAAGQGKSMEVTVDGANAMNRHAASIGFSPMKRFRRLLSPPAHAILAKQPADSPARRLQDSTNANNFETMAGNYSVGTRTLLAVRVIFNDQTASNAEPYNTYLSMWNSISVGHSMRSFGKLKWVITTPPSECVYNLSGISSSTSAVSAAGSGGLQTAALAAVKNATGSCYFDP